MAVEFIKTQKVNPLYKNKYQRLHFSVYGVEFCFNSNSNFYITELTDDFKYFQPKSRRMSYPEFSITIHLIKNSHFPMNPSLKAKLSREPFLGSDNQKFRTLNYENRWFFIENSFAETIYLLAPESRIGHIFTTAEDIGIYHAISDIVMNFLSMYLLRRNIFCVHAAALSKDNIGFLFPGRSGSGKTTISISLVKSGYKFLSDDYPLIRSYNSNCEILAFPQRLKIRADTFGQYSELIAYAKKMKIQRIRPFIDISEVFLGCLTEKVAAVFLVFPNLVNSLKTSYVNISKKEALKNLLPCMYDPFSRFKISIELRKSIFEFAYNLVNKAKCYNLFLGKNSRELRAKMDSMYKL